MRKNLRDYNWEIRGRNKKYSAEEVYLELWQQKLNLQEYVDY